jgi:hypothetical protein
MNQSIYLMLAVPYTSLAVLIFFVYRGLKKNAAYLAELRRVQSAQPPPQIEG